MSARRKRIATEVVLAGLTILLGVWIVVSNMVPGGVFVAARGIDELSPWIKNFWPPTFVYPVERGTDGRWQQRIAVSPVTVRVRIPRSFASVTVALDADGVPFGSSVGVERALNSGQYVTGPFADQGTTLSLAGVSQGSRDLQFQFTFPNLERAQPVIVHALRFSFRTQ